MAMEAKQAGVALHRGINHTKGRIFSSSFTRGGSSMLKGFLYNLLNCFYLDFVTVAPSKHANIDKYELYFFPPFFSIFQCADFQ